MIRRIAGNTLGAAMTAGFVISFLAITLGTLFFGFVLASTVYAASTPEQVNENCLKCHNQNSPLPAVDAITFQESVHGDLYCYSCHPSAKDYPHQNMDGQSLLAEVNESCQQCHINVGSEFSQSIHGETGAATCTNCHGEGHAIGPVEDSALASKQGLNETCMSCHQGMVADSYQESFHGSAVSLGYDKAASCADCHGTHGVLAVTNPNSRVHPDQIGQTCTSCHGGEPVANWANGTEHTTVEDREGGFPLWITWKIFLLLIMVDILKDLPIVILELWRQYQAIRSARRVQKTGTSPTTRA